MLKTVILIILFLVSCSTQKLKLYSKSSYTYHHELIKTKYRGGIEIVWGYKPSKLKEKMPLVLIMNGPFLNHQNEGAVDDLKNAQLKKWIDRGFVAGSISLPGYGNSKANDDFAGPYSQHSIRKIIRYMKKRHMVNPNKLVLVGIGKGAIIAGLISKKSKSKVNILIDPPIDFRQFYYSLPRRSSLRKDIFYKIGQKDKIFKHRSLTHNTEKLSGATYFTLGSKNRHIKQNKLVQLYQKLFFSGTKTEVKLYENHVQTPYESEFETFYKYVIKHL